MLSLLVMVSFYEYANIFFNEPRPKFNVHMTSYERLMNVQFTLCVQLFILEGITSLITSFNIKINKVKGEKILL